MGSNAKEEGIDQPETIEELEIKYGIGASEKTGKSGNLLHEDGAELERKLQLEDAARDAAAAAAEYSSTAHLLRAQTLGHGVL